MHDPLDTFAAFSAAVRSRLDAGREAYGDRSFSADPAVLIGELEQECQDLAGWGFVLWTRLETMLSSVPTPPSVSGGLAQAGLSCFCDYGFCSRPLRARRFSSRRWSAAHARRS